MGEYDLFDILYTQFSLNEGRSTPDHLTAVRSEQMDTYDGLGIAMANDLYQACGFFAMLG